MSHRITIQEARLKREHEEETQKLALAGKYHSNRHKLKREQHESKINNFIQMLKDRHGYHEQKDNKKKTKEQKKQEQDNVRLQPTES